MQLIYNAQYQSTTYTHHFPDKLAGYSLSSYISKQTSMKITNSGTTTER